MSVGVAVGSLLALLGVGVIFVFFLLQDRSDEGDDLEWHLELRRALGLQPAVESGRTVTVSVHGAFVDFISDNGLDFDVVTVWPERDLSAQMRDGEVATSGDGWDRLEAADRDAVSVFVRDTGRIHAGRIQIRAKGIYAPAELLAELDRTLAPTGAQAAATIVVAGATRVFGACAGDVEALYGDVDLTKDHRRKPLLGSGEVEPVSFAAEGPATLLVATDGLFRYAKRDAIAGVLGSAPPESAPDRLVELVRLRSGDLQDDVGLAICALADP